MRDGILTGRQVQLLLDFLGEPERLGKIKVIESAEKGDLQAIGRFVRLLSKTIPEPKVNVPRRGLRS